MLKDKNIIVTGANRGIGLAIVKECAKNHANLWACVRNCSDEIKKIYDEMQEEYGVNIQIVELDLINSESIKCAATSILNEKIGIDGVVNNAGTTGSRELFSMTSMDEIRDTFEVNFFGPMFFLQRLLRRMIKGKSGSVVNISSIAAIDGEPAQFEYVSSKAAIIGATRKLASELNPFGIRVNAVAPGMIDTEMIEEMDESLKAKTLERTVMKRLGTSEEIAKTVVFLLSENSSFITGQVIRVDGGGY